MITKSTINQLIHCIHTAKQLGFDDVEYRINGFALIKDNEEKHSFPDLDTLQYWLSASINTRVIASNQPYYIQPSKINFEQI